MVGEVSEGSYVFYAVDMVGVGMCPKEGSEMCEEQRGKLLSEFGACIYENHCVSFLNQQTSSTAVVFGVFGVTIPPESIAVWKTSRRAATKECDFHDDDNEWLALGKRVRKLLVVAEAIVFKGVLRSVAKAEAT